MLMLWHKLKKALSLKCKDNNSQNETHHSKSPDIPSSQSSLSHLPSPTARSSTLPFSFLLSFYFCFIIFFGTCVICLGNMKAEKGEAIFTAECMHSFHFSCIGENVKHGNLLCPICRCKWKETPFQFATDDVTIVHRIRVLIPVNRSLLTMMENEAGQTGQLQGKSNQVLFQICDEADVSKLFLQ
ncbi:hypothetical protein RDI58_004160 [Solanum bulbocastanum]|uniref:RING-type domain-containing protein n=1 Tax=Solanum bulbocastanum TaxID=147425 RepID=A0AAN8U146_SOLBU